MVDILGVPIFSESFNSGITTILNYAEADTRNNYLVSATGAHGIITAKRNKEFNNILGAFTVNFPDGMPSVWVGRLKGAKSMERCYGPDVFKEVIRQSAHREVKHFFCGGKEGIAVELKISCERKFQNKNIVGVFCPPFRNMSDEELQELARQINSSMADIVWIGLSTPKQEIFAFRLAKFTNVKLLIAVGAAFDFHTDKVKQAPRLIQNMGMEWFFRLIMEPKRLYKRYFNIVPSFIYYNFLEFLYYFFHRREIKSNE